MEVPASARGPQQEVLLCLQHLAPDSALRIQKPAYILAPAVTRPGSFVGDAQRLNVALTRAKHHLILVRALYLLASAQCRIIALSCTPSPPLEHGPLKHAADSSADSLKSLP